MLTAHPPGPAGTPAPLAAAVWIDLLNATDEEAQTVERETGLHLPTRAKLSAIEQSSRLVFADNVLRLSCPVAAGAGTDHPDLSELGLILTPQRLISIRFDPLPVFDKMGGQPASGSSLAVFATLMEAIIERLADLLEASRAQLDEVSHRVFRRTGSEPRQVMRSTMVMREKLQLLGRIGERTSMIRETLLAVDRMIAFSLEAAKDWFEPALARQLDAVRKDIDSLNLFEEHLLGKVQFLLDAVLGFIGIEQNDIFKVLTIASVVGIFPTLVAGWYGMNFANMPEYHWAYGYQFGIGVIIASTVLPLLWFKWRGWI